VPKSALLVGATGLVGGECLKLLANDSAVSRVVVVTRKECALPTSCVPIDHHRIDFAKLADYPELFTVDAVICTLGTTIKKAGSPAAFRLVDYEYPLRVAQLARQAGAAQFVIVTAIGADPNSRVFYNRVKGEVERDLAALNFPSLVMLRPSLILGARHEFRFGERVSVLTLGKLRGLFPRSIRPVSASAVARAAVASLSAPPTGQRIITNSEIARVA
jgi:uncharacterized protein YbjT (DUF2867 family)